MEGEIGFSERRESRRGRPNRVPLYLAQTSKGCYRAVCIRIEQRRFTES